MLRIIKKTKINTNPEQITVISPWVFISSFMACWWAWDVISVEYVLSPL